MYISPVVETIKMGLIWKRRYYRRLALRFHEDGSCEEHAVDFPEETLPSTAVRVLGSVRSRPGADEVTDLGPK